MHGGVMGVHINGGVHLTTSRNGRPMLTNGKKSCNDCGSIFPATNEYFNKRSCSADGLASVCKECSRERQRKFRASRPGYGHQQYVKHREKCLQWAREHQAERTVRARENYHKNHELYLETKRKYRENNREHLNALARKRNQSEANKEYHRQYKQTEKYKEQQRQYRMANRERISAYQREWYRKKIKRRMQALSVNQLKRANYNNC